MVANQPTPGPQGTESHSPQTQPPPDPEFVRMYYEHQYDRMAQQENQRHSMANIIISLSVIALSLAFAGQGSPNVVTGLLLPIVIGAANLIGLMYMERTRSWIRVHRQRAKRTLEGYAPALLDVEVGIRPAEREKPVLGRGRLQQALHVVLIAVSVVVLVFYLGSVIWGWPVW